MGVGEGIEIAFVVSKSIIITIKGNKRDRHLFYR